MKMFCKTAGKTAKNSIAMMLFAVVMLSGCAAIFKGTSEEVNFYSKPSGAEVYVNGQYRGTTPILNLKLKSDKNYFIEIKKDGFVTHTTTINSELSIGYLVLDVLFTGLIGIVIDASTGAWYTFDENDIGAVLKEMPKTEK